MTESGKQVAGQSALWTRTGNAIQKLASVGYAAPGTDGAVFASLPEVAGLNAQGDIVFLAKLSEGSGDKKVDEENDSGLWTDLGGGKLYLLLREGALLPGVSDVRVAGFASGAFATARTGKGRGDVVVPVLLKGKKTGSALLRLKVEGTEVKSVAFLAEEGASVPGQKQSFGILSEAYTDPVRMDAAGNVAYAALLQPANQESLWYQSREEVAQKVFVAGDVAPGNSGAVFAHLHKPALGSDGVMAFRAKLTMAGDNGGGLKGDGIWRGSAKKGFQCILRWGDAGLPGMPQGSKVGNVWSGWLTVGNHGAWKAWLDTDGDGVCKAPKDVHAIYADMSGTMSLVVRQGDAAPGVPGARLAAFDSPVVGGQEQLAFLGKLDGPDVKKAEDQGLWRQQPHGGPLALILRTGMELPTALGRKKVAKLDFPGSGMPERRWEQPVMGADGQVLVHATFVDGTTGLICVP